MDAHKKAIKHLQVERTIKSLAKNNIEARFISSIAEVVPTIASLMKEGESVAVGGSVTLDETGVLEYLRNGSYVFYDRYKKGISKEELDEVFLKSFSADTYLSRDRKSVV